MVWLRAARTALAKARGDTTKARRFSRTSSPINLQTCRKRLGCVNPASWLPLAAGASSRNLAFAFSCMSVHFSVDASKVFVPSAQHLHAHCVAMIHHSAMSSRASYLRQRDRERHFLQFCRRSAVPRLIPPGGGGGVFQRAVPTPEF